MLPLTKETIHLLKEKHPPLSDSEGLRLQGCRYTPNSVTYEIMTKEVVWNKSLQTHGSADPSGLHSRGWSRLLSGIFCGSAANDLCSTLTELAGKLATTTCHHLDALTASRLIPLDKKKTGM